MSETVAPPARPITHINGKPITIEGARECLRRNPPGQGLMHMHMEQMYEAPFYIEWLLDRLAEAQTPKPATRRRRKKT